MQQTEALTPTEFETIYGTNRKTVGEAKGIFDKLLPTDVSDPHNSLETAAGYIAEGRGLIVVMNHPTAGDHLRLGRTIFRNDTIRNSPLNVAIAHHQFSRPIELFMNHLGVNAQPVVTENTVKKGRNKLHPTQKINAVMEYVKSRVDNNDAPVQQTIQELWEELQQPLTEGHGGRNYLKKAGATLNQGGVVVLGPQGTRSKTLEMWDRGPIRFLLSAVDKRKHLGFVFLGIDERGGGNGLNLLKTYGITVDNPFTFEELSAFAKGQNISLDEAVYIKLREVVEKAKGTSEHTPLKEGRFTKIKSWVSQKHTTVPAKDSE